ncbi:MAG TPA: hypothetical protein VEL75_17710 [Candidatus Methylomirabilis sp.]|nr:hypothetical protein [Candidatus Methylomirabilis sp.]
MRSETAALEAPTTRIVLDSGRGGGRWWQWLLLYPSVGVALISAIPAWIDQIQAARIGVGRRDLAQAQEQNRLWQANLDCARLQEMQRIKTNRNIEVGAQVCPSGDVLLLLKRTDSDEPSFHWVSGRLLEQQASRWLEPAAALAASRDMVSAQGSQRVLYQRWLRPGLLKQRVREGGETCSDLIINTYTGNVVSRTPVGCGAEF